MQVASVLLIALVGLSAAKEIETSRAKRQGVYYVCGSNPNTFVSQYPCSNIGTNCGSYNNYCNNGNNFPTAFYNSNNNCGCSNFNCNSYTGQYLNGQYVAYTVGTNQYSPCASSCCATGNGLTSYSVGNGYNVVTVSNGFNNGFYDPYRTGLNTLAPFYNPYSNINGLNGVNTNFGPTYNPYANIVSPPLNQNSNGDLNPSNLFRTAAAARGPTCGDNESPSGYCVNGYCTNGLHCVQGNICCSCQIGSNGGKCNLNSDCSAGYTCTQNGHCCAQIGFNGRQLERCDENKKCPINFTCGSGDICYPQGF